MLLTVQGGASNLLRRLGCSQYRDELPTHDTDAAMSAADDAEASINIMEGASFADAVNLASESIGLARGVGVTMPDLKLRLDYEHEQARRQPGGALRDAPSYQEPAVLGPD